MVEGWAEEILIPALVKKMKASGVIDKDLTEAGVSLVNIGSTAFLRYSRIFLRETEPEMDIPVAVLTDVDVREYEKVPKRDSNGNIQKNCTCANEFYIETTGQRHGL